MGREKKDKSNFPLKVVIPIALIFLGIGFFVGMEYKAYQIRKVFDKESEEIEESISTTTRVEEKKTEDITGTELQKFLADKKIIESNIGDEIELATVNVTVKSVEEKDIFNRKYSEPLVARENAKFVIVSMDVKNTTEGKFDFRGRNIPLIDENNREYQSSGDLYSSDGDLGYREISPDLTESGILLYEVPKDSMNYSLIFAKAGTNEVYKVILEEVTPSPEVES